MVYKIAWLEYGYKRGLGHVFNEHMFVGQITYVTTRDGHMFVGLGTYVHFLRGL